MFTWSQFVLDSWCRLLRRAAAHGRSRGLLKAVKGRVEGEAGYRCVS